MKHFNKYALLYSFIILVIALSAFSMSAAPSNMRLTWDGINPWNGIRSFAFTIGYIIPVATWGVYLITAGVILVIWWRLYSLFYRKRQN